MNRELAPEWLDVLPVDTPEALDSRRDLQRLNAFLRHPTAVAKALVRSFPAAPPRQIVELGAGDGSFMLRTCRLLARRWPKFHVILVDRLPAAGNELKRDFEALRWTMEFVSADVFDWLNHNAADAALANLFLHHLDRDALGRLLQVLAARTKVVIACEPYRAAVPLALSHLLGLAGANAVTRHDAPISVRAGFRRGELTALWPKQGWKIEETVFGFCSHLFAATGGS